MRMPAIVCSVVLAAAACGPAPPESSPDPAPMASSASATQHAAWMICDAIDQGPVLIFEQPPSAGESRLIEIDKEAGAPVADRQIVYGEAEGAAGSAFIPLSEGGHEAGYVRSINPGMLENPGSAYTMPVSSVQLGNVDTQCRWLPRTRLTGVTDKRVVVVHEDADGDLIYTTFDFAGAAARAPIELSENGRSTTFSVEVRDGQEQIAPGAAAFTFDAPDNYEYRVLIDAEGPRVEVWRDGAKALTESFMAYQVGEAE